MPNAENDLAVKTARALAVAQLVADLGGEITQVVEGMHSNISRLPLPLGKYSASPARGISGMVYRGISGTFGAIASGLASTSKALDINAGVMADERVWLQFRAAVGGVCGDRLEARGNPLAMPMQILPVAGKEQSRCLLLFVHGLCMSEIGWRGPHYEQFVANFDGAVGHVRYNSGRHISTNGHELAERLESYCLEHKVERLILVGHSMGGLLSRSALASAAEKGFTWPAKLSHLACIGSPHHGAPMERAGNMANSILTVSPYSAALAGLGNLRSAGIRDLRHGNVIDSDWQNDEELNAFADKRSPVALPGGDLRVLFLAGTRSEVVADDYKGAKHDLLVPVSSALGSHKDLNFVLRSDRLTQHVLPATDHMALLEAESVYQFLTDWLAE